MEEFAGRLNEHGITAGLGLNILSAIVILILGRILVWILDIGISIPFPQRDVHLFQAKAS
jgi:hypothetical protein